MKRHLVLPALLLLTALAPLQAQYFGRNKPTYQKHDFKVLQTEHFEIYQYLDNPERARELAAAAEMWYRMHESVLRDTFTEKNPMVIYNDHAGFQQTNTIQGDVSVGTGGVTEALRNRVVFPVAMTNQQTNHVLGHELVHAFQYHMILEGDSTSLRNLANLPLWMVEGLAEYLSIGRIDPHTALWMRDAVLNDDLPSIRDLDGYKYFPYRWGQAFWAFVTGVYGDEVIPVLFKNTAKYGLEPAVRLTLNTTTKELSEAWQTSLRNQFGQWAIKGKKENLPGKRLLDDDNAGKMNICPVLSPNGKYVIFLSEKSIFTTDLFLADAKTGKIIKKVASTAKDGHIDQFNFIESAGTWSADGKQFAFDVYEKGRSVLVIKDVLKGKRSRKVEIRGVPAFSNPAWSPDGKTIVVSGLVKGQVDLFAWDVKTGKVRRLTNDKYAEILPTWSADGRQLAFSTDQLSMNRGRSNGTWVMNLAVMDVASGAVEQIDVFPGADNLNPQFDKDGNLFFLSNGDGFRNLYRYDMASKKVFKMTDLMVGITGITPYSPAITVAEDRDRVLYTYYNKGEYTIFQAKAEDFLNQEVPDPSAINMVPAALPPFDPRKKDVVNTGIRTMDHNLDTMTETKTAKYRSQFKLDYIGGSTGVGVATGNTSFGTATGLAGGIDMLFGDILGNHQLYAGLSLNGEVTDAAGIFSYINRKNRVGWGASLSHIPDRYVSGYYFDSTPEYYNVGNGDSLLLYEDFTDLTRIFQERLGLFTFYPFSTTKRIELGGAMELYTDRVDRYKSYYTTFGQYFGQDRERIPSPGSLRMASLNTAFVGDNSHFGFTAPLQGWRYRIGAEQYFGDYRFTALLADARRYFFLKPVTLAVRGFAYGRFGGNSEQIYPLPAWDPFFVRGYIDAVQQVRDLPLSTRGSKLLVGNFEVRLPFTGPRAIALIPVNGLLTDLNLFADAGLAFFELDDLKKEGAPGTQFTQHKPIVSVGASLRVNLFGALVIEPYYALPLSLEKADRKWTFGLNFIPGW